MKSVAITVAVAVLTSLAAQAQAQSLSPETWPVAQRERAEQLEFDGASPPVAGSVSGRGGMVSATVSPIAVLAGIQALDQGGTAADAAATVALTQITTQLGSVVSYAGIFTGLYYDAASDKVYSLDGGYNSFLGEDDPRTIPVGDLGPLNFGPTPTQGGAKGREILTPGFMAGLEALHGRFGRLPFRELFAPAIWYDEHGIRISATLDRYFGLRQAHLSRTVEGRAFMAQAGGERPAIGSLFVQADLAETLRGVAEHGAAYMYTGAWGQDFVRTVQGEGGKVTPEDMARYQVIWSEPYETSVFGHTVYVNGAPHYGAYNLIPALNIAEARGVQNRGPYWQDARTFTDLVRATEVVTGSPALNPGVLAFLQSKGIDASAQAQLTKAYADQVAPVLDELFPVADTDEPRHSNSIVVVDRDGNVAVITHTINAVVWGDTGIVVGGVPIPDSAAFQQERLAAMTPGDRLPHEILDTIAFKDGKPVLATAAIGSSLVPETIRTLVGVLGQGQTVQTVMAAPPLLTAIDWSGTALPGATPTPVPEGAYDADFVAKLAERGLQVAPVPEAMSHGLRGTLAVVQIDLATGERTAADQPGVMVFNGAQ